MAAKIYIVSIRSGGAPVAGLTPAFVGGTMVRVSDGTAISSPPAVTELNAAKTPGQYKFLYDPVVPSTGQIDAGAGVPDPADRYIDVACLS